MQDYKLSFSVGLYDVDMIQDTVTWKKNTYENIS